MRKEKRTFGSLLKRISVEANIFICVGLTDRRCVKNKINNLVVSVAKMKRERKNEVRSFPKTIPIKFCHFCIFFPASFRLT